MVTYESGGNLRVYHVDKDGRIRYTFQHGADDCPTTGSGEYRTWEEAMEGLLDNERIVPPEILDAFFDYLEKNHGNY